MVQQFFFGYGSLVNARTHAYPRPEPAVLRGWRRVWRPTALRAEAFLSVRPSEGDAIRGLIAPVPDGDWTALDAREAGYDRHPVTADVDHAGAGGRDIRVYAVPDRAHRPDLAQHVLLSYIDVVVQGFLHQYGREGVEHFFATTDDWPALIRDDRAAPLYPRHQVLTDAERGIVDRALADLPVTVAAAP